MHALKQKQTWCSFMSAFINFLCSPSFSSLRAQNHLSMLNQNNMSTKIWWESVLIPQKVLGNRSRISVPEKYFGKQKQEHVCLIFFEEQEQSPPNVVWGTFWPQMLFWGTFWWILGNVWGTWHTCYELLINCRSQM